MAKCQRIMRNMFFRAEGNRKIVGSKVAISSTSSTPFQPLTKFNHIQKSQC